jgi:HEAT repeat protein
LAGLKAFAHQPEVQKVLSQTVLTDTNPGVRTEAIDLLTQGLSAGPGQQQLVGVLQQLMRKEHNGYVRMRCQKALEELNASLETY